tara:strand:- start:535 stop:732 length:198 start_codon:yes stop_codon:yes gene_type:complete
MSRQEEYKKELEEMKDMVKTQLVDVNVVLDRREKDMADWLDFCDGMDHDQKMRLRKQKIRNVLND